MLRPILSSILPFALVAIVACKKTPAPQTPSPDPATGSGSADPAPPAGGYQACAGKSCGASCTVCDPADSSCVETAVEKMCDPTGKCDAITPTCP